MSDDLDAPRCPVSLDGECLHMYESGEPPCPPGECDNAPESDDLDALLARADQYPRGGVEGRPLVADLAAAVRSLQATNDAWAFRWQQQFDRAERTETDYDTALDVIGRLDNDWRAIPPEWVLWAERGGRTSEPMPDAQRELIWTARRRAVLAAAETRRIQDTGA